MCTVEKLLELEDARSTKDCNMRRRRRRRSDDLE
jgi:hypothetical protein